MASCSMQPCEAPGEASGMEAETSENTRTMSKGQGQRQALVAGAALRPRTPTQGAPRPSDLSEERRLEEASAARMQSTIRSVQDSGSFGLGTPEDRSRSKMRQNLERSFKNGQLPSSSTRCFRCGADHPDSVCRDLHEFLQKQKIPKYKKLPDVEVSFKVRSISDLDSKTGTFLADFLLELHWVDPGLERDTHYTEDYQSQTLQLFPAFESHIFNPEVVLENAVEALVPLSDSQPEIQAEAIHGLWMRRRVHFKGLLACANISYANFPLDTHAISISVALKKWQGITPKVVSPVPEVKEVRKRSKDQKQQDWPGHVVSQDSIHLGDLNFVAWGVWSHHGPETVEGQREEDQYELIMVMRRSFRRHFFTFFILSMAVLSGATSLFCPLSIDMLAGRLSINVTVLLSMVAFSVQRPSAIEAVPYNTIHDIFVQVCTLLTATLSLCNLATQLTCFEMTDGCDECVREDLPDLCALGSCGSKADPPSASAVAAAAVGPVVVSVGVGRRVKKAVPPRRLAHPTVLEGAETHYLDLGGGEVGYYRYCNRPDAPPLEQARILTWSEPLSSNHLGKSPPMAAFNHTGS
eukprot:Skav233359  [mRNA]  locus=scaffold394:563544:565803:+ [translate_table: standard]